MNAASLLPLPSSSPSLLITPSSLPLTMRVRREGVTERPLSLTSPLPELMEIIWTFLPLGLGMEAVLAEM